MAEFSPFSARERRREAAHWRLDGRRWRGAASWWAKCFAKILKPRERCTHRTRNSSRAEGPMNKSAKTQPAKSRPAPPDRPEDANKGSFGRVMVVAGSRGMSGAACLAGVAALRGGAGLVTVATAAGVLTVVEGVEPSLLTL